MEEDISWDKKLLSSHINRLNTSLHFGPVGAIGATSGEYYQVMDFTLRFMISK